MNKLNYQCDKTPNGLCVDCTNDRPLCDFDECEYVNLYQNNPNNNRKNEPNRKTEASDVESISCWISVKERLPEEDGKYMVWYKGEWYICEFDAESQTFGDTYDDYDEMYSHLVCWDDSIDKNVTHWMPLPKPPKGEDGWVDDESMPNEDMIPDNELIGGW